MRGRTMDERELVGRLLGGGLEPGPTRSAGALTLVPLWGGAPAPEYALAHQAMVSGDLTISELGGGDVTQLAVHNQGAQPVLIVDGEHLEGAMQDRVVIASTLVPARTKVVLSVACVEHGRWHYEGGHHFGVR